MPQPDVRDPLKEVLLKIPYLNTQEGRNTLTGDLPVDVSMRLTRSANPTIDLLTLVNELWLVGQLENGEWALVRPMKTARFYCTPNSPELKRLDELIARYEASYSEAPQPAVSAASLEQIIGRDERLRIDFFDGVQRAQKAVARVQTPLLANAGQTSSTEFSLGTGWLIAPQALITNYHVISGRDPGKALPDADTLRAQALNSQIWLGYNDEHSQPHIYPVTALEDFDPEIDYALLRLGETAANSGVPLADWGQLTCRKDTAPLQARSRLNIIQHPFGSVKHFAIRANYFTEPVAPYHIHYVTDTEPGASGSPVMDDDWRVVAMHCASDLIKPYAYHGEMIFMNNRGIKIEKILDAIRTRQPNLAGQIRLG